MHRIYANRLFKELRKLWMSSAVIEVKDLASLYLDK